MEKVLVVKTDIINPYLSKENFVADNIPEVIETIKNNYIYLDRDIAEYSQDYKQIIPYVILVHNDYIFMAQRLKTQTEKRLHGMHLIGMGGHINPSEEDSEDVILEGMKRELMEEVGMEDIPGCECVGIINDNSAEVSNYHIGLVYVLCTDLNVQVAEKNKMTGQWIPMGEVEKYYDNMESWSQIAWNARKYWRISTIDA